MTTNNESRKNFLLLGDVKRIKNYERQLKLSRILSIEKENGKKPIWATLGWKNNDKFNPIIINSKKGNTDTNQRDSLTHSIIEEIKSFNTQVKKENDAVERYVNFDSADFNIEWKSIKSYNDIPDLRLDLFLEKNEGAMVYYYHQHKDNIKTLNDSDVFEQFIQPEATKDHTSDRDKLSYYFKPLPPFDYELDSEGNIDWGDEERLTSFIIKIVTFKRNEGTPEKLMHEFFGHESIKTIIKNKGKNIPYNMFGKEKNRLWIYDNKIEHSSIIEGEKTKYDMAGAFYHVDDKHKIDRTKKTLLLIHGTFSNTFNTFRGLIEYQDKSSELKEFLKNNVYEQVIAFDHPTISADVFQNIKDLKVLLGTTKFTKTVSMIAASRGCILTQAIGADKTLPFKVDKALMFSPANGVGYFSAGDKLAVGLGILKRVTEGTVGKYIFALLQFSAKYFLDQPGSQQMTFGSKELKKVEKLKLANPNSKYTSVVNDWEKQLTDGWLKRAGMIVADNVIKLILGFKHDFVVGVKGQRNTPKAFDVNNVPMASIHTKYFKKDFLHIRHGKTVILSHFIRKYL